MTKSGVSERERRRNPTKPGHFIRTGVGYRRAGLPLGRSAGGMSSFPPRGSTSYSREDIAAMGFVRRRMPPGGLVRRCDGCAMHETHTSLRTLVLVSRASGTDAAVVADMAAQSAVGEVEAVEAVVGVTMGGRSGRSRPTRRCLRRTTARKTYVRCVSHITP